MLTKSAKLCSVGAMLLLAGCIQAPQYDSEFAAQFERTDQKSDDLFASGYFPKSFGEPIVDYCDFPRGPLPLIGEVEAEWYPQQLKAAREPSFFLLSEQKTPPEMAIRFSYIPSFSPSIFVRLHKDDDGYTLYAKRLSGAGGYEPGSISSSKRIRLSDQQASELELLLQREALFDEPADGCSSGFDGSKWIFETVERQNYTMIKRWSPTEGPAYNLGRYLVELTGWNFESSCLRPFPYPLSDIEVLCD